MRERPMPALVSGDICYAAMKAGLVLLGVVGGTDIGAQEAPSRAPVQVVRNQIMVGNVQGASHGDLARYRPALLRVYADSASRALWVADARLTRQAEALLAELGAAEKRGLRPSDYDGIALTLALGRTAPSRAINDVESQRNNLSSTNENLMRALREKENDIARL